MFWRIETWDPQAADVITHSRWQAIKSSLQFSDNSALIGNTDELHKLRPSLNSFKKTSDIYFNWEESLCRQTNYCIKGKHRLKVHKQKMPKKWGYIVSALCDCSKFLNIHQKSRSWPWITWCQNKCKCCSMTHPNSPEIFITRCIMTIDLTMFFLAALEKMTGLKRRGRWKFITTKKLHWTQKEAAKFCSTPSSECLKRWNWTLASYYWEEVLLQEIKLCWSS